MAKVKEYPSQSILKEIFYYKDGQLIWKLWNNKINRVGRIAGCNKNTRYRKIYIKIGSVSGTYLAHRLIWIYHNSDIPDGLFIDHINMNKTDNRIENLQLISDAENKRKQKLRTDNKSGHVGVFWCKQFNKWNANIYHGRYINLGYFKNKKDAIKARKEADIKYGYNIKHGSIINE